jgi:hypothetical protein
MTPLSHDYQQTMLRFLIHREQLITSKVPTPTRSRKVFPAQMMYSCLATHIYTHTRRA